MSGERYRLIWASSFHNTSNQICWIHVHFEIYIFFLWPLQCIQLCFIHWTVEATWTVFWSCYIGCLKDRTWSRAMQFFLFEWKDHLSFSNLKCIKCALQLYKIVFFNANVLLFKKKRQNLMNFEMKW